MASSTSLIPRSKLAILLLILTALLSLSSVHAQFSPSPSPSPSPPPPPADTTTLTPTETISPSASATSATSTGAAPTSTAVVPDPIFPPTPDCAPCKADFHAIRDCSARIPFSSNLTIINQVLPFYQCMCPNDGTLIDSLQHCSVCLRSSGQLAYLNIAFYNVTNQDVKAMKQICVETQNGSVVPSGSAGLWSNFNWGLFSVMMLVLPLFSL